MIHRPFKRIHAVMYVFGAAWVAGALLVVLAFLNATVGSSVLWEVVAGLALLIGLYGLGGAVICLMYFAYQLSIDLREGRLGVRSWVRLGPLGTDREIEVGHASRSLILRPYFVEFEIPGATTRVWSMYQLVRDRDRFGTMWWFDEDYRALQELLHELGIPVDYRDHRGLLGRITSR